MSERRPVIGITSHPRTLDIASGPTRLHTLSAHYVNAVLRAGGLPVVLPVLPPEHADEVVDAVDGILLTGGGDVDPARYGAAPHASTGGTDAERDAFEVALVRAVVARELAALAICRGMQVANVALGGSLEQHLEDVTGWRHDDSARWMEPVHDVTVEAGTRLERVAGRAFAVNSIHHQGVARLAPDAVPAARAPDGTVEAFEAGAELIAVQWHPELLPDHVPHRSLFDDLVKRASRSHRRTSDERDRVPRR